jgi:uncharacterized protein (DUF305 family)
VRHKRSDQQENDLMRIHLNRTVALAAAILVAAALAACGSSSSSSHGAATHATANAVDHAFVQQMIPHHKMAVQMARTAQAQAQHPAVKTLAASIITSQTHEIKQMTAIAHTLGVTPDQMPAGGSMGAHMGSDDHTLGLTFAQSGMSMNMSTLSGSKPFDRMFIDMMIPHHQGAIRMARVELANGTNPQLRSIATGIIAAQTKEIKQMNTWRTSWFGASSPAGGVPTA